MTFSWTFPISTGDEPIGFFESGLETFRSAPFKSIVREVIQNSMDARKVKTEPVRVEFKLQNFPVDEFPGLEQFKQIISKCTLYSQANPDYDAEKQFFKTASRLLVPDTSLRVLNIKDSNTFGLNHPKSTNCRWTTLVKSVGQSAQVTATAGGSFGIGKFAPYIGSQLQTLFISSLFEGTNGELEMRTQGRSILRGYDDDDGMHLHRGYWGVEEDSDGNKCTYVPNFDVDCPIWIQHCKKESEMVSENTGTTLSISGFSDIWDKWKSDLKISVVENFFAAVYQGDLVVSIEGEEINADNIAQIFEDQSLRAYIEGSPSYSKADSNQFEMRRNFFSALLSPTPARYESHIRTGDLTGLGTVKLSILLGEGLPKKVSALRNGMHIAYGAPFHNQLKSFGGCKDFVAVFECTNKRGNAILRMLEPPAHDSFDIKKLNERPEFQTEVRSHMLEMARWIREQVESVAEIEPVAIDQILDLADYFSDEDSGTGGSNSNKEEDPLSTIDIALKKQKVPTYPATEFVVAIEDPDGIDILVPEGTGGEGPVDPVPDTPGIGVEGDGPGIIERGGRKMSVLDFRSVL